MKKKASAIPNVIGRPGGQTVEIKGGEVPRHASRSTVASPHLILSFRDLDTGGPLHENWGHFHVPLSSK